MNFLQQIDATIIVAVIALIGTFATVIANKAGKKQDTIIETNEQLMAMLKCSQEEIRLLKEQYAQESQRLENKIVQLENQISYNSYTSYVNTYYDDKISELNKNIYTLNTNISTLNTKINKLENRILKLENHIDNSYTSYII